MELEELDPAQETATAQTDQALDKLQYYDKETMLRTLPGQIYPSQSTLIVIEAPTSKLTTNFRCFEIAVELCKKIVNGKVAILCHTGGRIDLASAMIAKGVVDMWGF